MHVCESSEGCMREASYGFISTNPSCCRAHVVGGMVYAKKRRQCAVPGCDRRAYFGHPGGLHIRCSLHVEADMSTHRINTVCKQEGCTSPACYGVDGVPYTCQKHKTQSMVPSRRAWCKEPGCGRLLSAAGAYCVDHPPVPLTSWPVFDFESDLNAVLFHPIKNKTRF